MCEYENRVRVLEDLLAHPSSRKSGKFNRKQVEREYFDSVLDLLELRMKRFQNNMNKLEGVLNDRERSVASA